VMRWSGRAGAGAAAIDPATYPEVSVALSGTTPRR
jgi:hypothetical protein